MICYFQLITGDEIIAEVMNRDPNFITMKEPVKIGFAPQGGLAMIPFSAFMKENVVTVSQKHVLFSGEADDELKNAYNSKFGSGIVLPDAGLQL